MVTEEDDVFGSWELLKTFEVDDDSYYSINLFAGRLYCLEVYGGDGICVYTGCGAMVKTTDRALYHGAFAQFRVPLDCSLSLVKRTRGSAHATVTIRRKTNRDEP